jgi:hypothetical protein
MAINSVSKNTETITMPVALVSSFLVDQETFFISVLTSEKNLNILFAISSLASNPSLLPNSSQFIAYRYCARFKILAGLEGFEPPTSGFGVRRSSQLELQAYVFSKLRRQISVVGSFLSSALFL